MARSLADSRRWAKDGFEEFRRTASALGEDALDEPSTLPEWNRRHVIAHVAANADALRNLMRWAATGTPTPMYASPEERTAGIVRGSRLTRDLLLGWLDRSGSQLEDAFDSLGPKQWEARVLTAQGRDVAASEVPWLRAREVWVHAVDLASASAFDTQPDDFLLALVEDVVTKRSAAPTAAVDVVAGDRRWQIPGEGQAPRIRGTLPQIVSYLTGRAHRLPTADEAPMPRLGAWL